MVRRLRSGADTSSEMETQGRRSSSRGAADACSRHPRSCERTPFIHVAGSRAITH
jgi:hypothetical protein